MGVCVWKATRPPQRQAIPRESAGTVFPAPDFELPDQGRDHASGAARRTDPSRRVRLRSYLGRHEILLAFFDGDEGADRDSVLLRLKSSEPQLRQRGIIVLAVTTALPQQNRAASQRAGGFPFPLLSDVDGTICAEWGCLKLRDDGARQTTPALFFIDRAGRVGWQDRLPRPESDPEQTIASLSES